MAHGSRIRVQMPFLELRIYITMLVWFIIGFAVARAMYKEK